MGKVKKETDKRIEKKILYKKRVDTVVKILIIIDTALIISMYNKAEEQIPYNIIIYLSIAIFLFSLIMMSLVSIIPLDKPFRETIEKIIRKNLYSRVEDVFLGSRTTLMFAFIGVLVNLTGSTGLFNLSIIPSMVIVSFLLNIYSFMVMISRYKHYTFMTVFKI